MLVANKERWPDVRFVICANGFIRVTTSRIEAMHWRERGHYRRYVAPRKSRALVRTANKLQAVEDKRRANRKLAGALLAVIGAKEGESDE